MTMKMKALLRYDLVLVMTAVLLTGGIFLQSSASAETPAADRA